MFLLQTADDIDLIHVLLQITGQDIQIVLCNCKTAMAEYLLERDHRTAHDGPFLSEGMPETVNSRLLQAPLMAIIPNSMIATAPRELFSIYGAEQPVIHLTAPILQIFLNDFDNVLI